MYEKDNSVLCIFQGTAASKQHWLKALSFSSALLAHTQWQALDPAISTPTPLLTLTWSFLPYWKEFLNPGSEN